MARKMFSFLRARVDQKRVKLTFYKSTRFFSSHEGEKQDLAIRVYRKTEPDFEFGQDYEEFFNGIDYRGAEMIFEGSLTGQNLRKYEFVDDNVSACVTYLYWVALPDTYEPVGPVAVRVRDPEVWWTKERMESFMDDIANKYRKSVHKEKFGTTVMGNAINGLISGNPQKMLAFIGNIHAGESGPELLLPALNRILEKDEGILTKIGIAILPSVNIDERERLARGCPWYLRQNAAGIDINRNFDAEWHKIDYGYGLISSDPDSGTYRGKCPESEPETKAVVNFINEVNPVAVFSFHALASICSASFIFSTFAAENAPFKKRAEILVNAYTEGMYPDKKMEIKLYPGCSPGSLSSWLYLKKGIHGFDLEHDGSENAKLSLTDLTTLKLVREYQERHYNGIVCVLKKIAAEE